MSTLYYIGEIQSILKAHLDEGALLRTMDATSFRYAFELATTSNAKSLGEAIAVNGRCYTTATDIDRPNYMKMTSARHFKTVGLFMIPNEAMPLQRLDCCFRGNTMQGKKVLDFYQDLYKKIKKPFAFAGIAQFLHLDANAICKAPINDHPIFNHKDEFYNRPSASLQNQTAFAMGVVADVQQAKQLGLDLSPVLYQSPFDQADTLSHHAHVLTLKQTTLPSQIEPDQALQVFHLLPDHSILSSFQGEIYTIDSLQALGEPS